MRKEEVEGGEKIKEGLWENESEAEEVRGYWCEGARPGRVGGAIYRKAAPSI